MQDIEHVSDAFVILRDGERLAEMTYEPSGDHHITIDHTWVSDELRGHGIARKLLDALVTWARDTGTRVSARCTYARSQFDKDESIRDVLAP